MAGLSVILDQYKHEPNGLWEKEVHMATSAHIVTQFPQSLTCLVTLIYLEICSALNAYTSLIVREQEFSLYYIVIAGRSKNSSSFFSIWCSVDYVQRLDPMPHQPKKGISPSILLAPRNEQLFPAALRGE